MEIKVDFIPKAADETTHIFPGGQSKKYIWVICSECNKGRWVNKYFINKSYFTGLCHPCHYKVKPHPPSGSLSPNWTGGKFTDKHGYVWVTINSDSPYWPMCSRRNLYSGYGYIREHRLVMAQYLGRPLESWEHVHHKPPGVKDDNRIENLKLTTGKRHLKEDTETVLQLQERVKNLEFRVIQLEAEKTLLEAQLVKE